MRPHGELLCPLSAAKATLHDCSSDRLVPEFLCDVEKEDRNQEMYPEWSLAIEGKGKEDRISRYSL